jgi:hypothetical protein
MKGIKIVGAVVLVAMSSNVFAETSCQKIAGYLGKSNVEAKNIFADKDAAHQRDDKENATKCIAEKPFAAFDITDGKPAVEAEIKSAAQKVIDGSNDLAKEKSANTPAVPVATAMDNNDWTGDQVQIRGNLRGLHKTGAAEGSAEYFAPAFVRFDVAKNKIEKGKTDKEKDTDKVEIVARGNFSKPTSSEKGGECTVIVNPDKGHGLYGWATNILESAKAPALSDCSTLIDPYESYTIDKSAIEQVPYVKYGWTYGGLVVPFKYQSQFKTVNFAPSYQVYVGYKRDNNGTAEGPFLSAGLSTADVCLF